MYVDCLVLYQWTKVKKWIKNKRDKYRNKAHVWKER